MHPRASLGVAIALLFCSRVSAADENDAERSAVLFDRGVENMQAKNFDVACSQIAESVRLERRPGALYTLARCEEDWGRIATAVARYDEFLLFCETLSDGDKAKQALRMTDAKLRRDKLAPDVAYWTITLASTAPPNTKVQRDGKPFEPKQLGVRVPVDPGTHVLTTQVPRGPVTEKRIDVARGSHTVLELTVLAPTVAGNEAKEVSSRRIAGWVMVGVGGAILGGGLVAGAATLGKTDIIENNCGAAIGSPRAPSRCNNTGFAALESANTSATIANVGVAVGVVGVAVGIILVATAPKPSAPKNTSFLHDVTVDLGPTPLGGGMAGLRGRW
jgi:hypothetical protein